MKAIAVITLLSLAVLAACGESEEFDTVYATDWSGLGQLPTISVESAETDPICGQATLQVVCRGLEEPDVNAGPAGADPNVGMRAAANFLNDVMKGDGLQMQTHYGGFEGPVVTFPARGLEDELKSKFGSCWSG